VFWPEVNAADQALMARQRGTGLQNAFYLGFDRRLLHFSIEDQGMAVTVPAGRWIHLAGTYDGSRVIVYVDGMEVGRQGVTAKVTAGGGVVSIGADLNSADTTAADSLFVGRLDEISIYNRALTPQEVAQLAK
jgi:hypothetical protein